jgi:histidine ammonia-lyase
MRTIEIDGGSLTLADVALAAEGGGRFVLSAAARARMAASRAVVESIVNEGRTVYGITTGFGVFSEVAISTANSRILQRNLILSHCAGIGPPYEVKVVRAMMLLRANALAKGFSGIRIEVVEQMLTMLERDVIPVIPSQGSVGASGDLAPLAHLAAALMGVGECWAGRQRVDAASALSAIEMAAVEYEPKEGLAMINGTQAIAAVGTLALHRASMLSEVADLVGAMTLDGLLGTDAAFDPRIHAARPHAGQVAVAENLRRLLSGSKLRESHRNCGRVQDAYSLRCMPQVHGAVRDALDFVRSKLEVEINAATDNPLIFPDDAAVLSGGNFHGAPVALACDVGAITVTTLAAISERRIERLVNPQLSGLPAFLVEDGGLNIGVEDSGPPGFGRFDPYLGQQGRSRLDGSRRGVEIRAVGREPGRRPGHRGDLRGAGDRLSPPSRIVRRDRRGPPGHPVADRALGERPLPSRRPRCGVRTAAADRGGGEAPRVSRSPTEEVERRRFGRRGGRRVGPQPCRQNAAGPGAGGRSTSALQWSGGRPLQQHRSRAMQHFPARRIRRFRCLLPCTSELRFSSP